MPSSKRRRKLRLMRSPNSSWNCIAYTCRVSNASARSGRSRISSRSPRQPLDRVLQVTIRVALSGIQERVEARHAGIEKHSLGLGLTQRNRRFAQSIAAHDLERMVRGRHKIGVTLLTGNVDAIRNAGDAFEDRMRRQLVAHAGS